MLIYQVYPRSFNDTNNDGVGDLKGITEKLDYIKSLSVDMIWVSPFFRSPMKDYGYDVSDFRDVDPLFGNLADCRELVCEAKARGMGIMVDMVISHTSDQHDWFKDSQHRRNSRDDWYLWADALADGSPPNNWLGKFGGPAWQWDANRRQYYFHSFLIEQPDINMHNAAVQDQLFADMEFWLEMGIAGFRMDAVSHYFQDALLRSNPPGPKSGNALAPRQYQEHLYDMYRPETCQFLERVRRLLDKYQAFSVAEVGGDHGLKYMAEYLQPGRMHSAYSNNLLRSEQSAEFIKSVVQTLEENIPGEAAACYALSNHDVPRVASRWGEGRETSANAKQLLALLAALRGPICLYQGEELGLPEADVPFERIKDPFGLPFWPAYKGRDGSRTPMPWTADLHGGFSRVEPWLPVDARHLTLSVKNQEACARSVLAFARKLFALRQSSGPLNQGSLKFLKETSGILLFSRSFEGRSVVCAFNLTESPVTFELAVQALDRVGGVLVAQEFQRTNVDCTLGVSGFTFIEG